jgi:diguanylate cyclase (GGDEF)-like protein
LSSLLRLATWILLAFLLPVRATLAADFADVAMRNSNIDLIPYFALLETGERDVPIERPGAGTGVKDFMTLHGKGPGPMFRWVAAGFANSGATARDVVIVVPDQGFVGSGIFWPKPLGGHVVSITTSSPLALQPLSATGEEAFAFTLAPGATAAVAFEITERGLAGASLWQRDAFDAQNNYYAFFRGALLGVAALLAAAMFALYGFRSRPVFLAAGGLATSSLAFMTLEAGHLPPIVAALQIPALTVALSRALIEGLMAAFLVLYLVTVAELRRLMPVVGNLLFLLGGLALAVPVYGFAEPLIASGIARCIFGVTAVAGFLLVFRSWRRGDSKAETALVSWSAILLWTFIALVAVFSDARGTSLSPLLLAGLCAVLVVSGFTLAHFAFSEGYLSRHFFREAGRRALALAGARAYVWDWQPDEGDLHVGEEIERALGHPPGLIADAGIEAFLDLMHPSDRAAYLGAVETAEQDGNGTIERKFRLRHGDGSWRWFQLRGRAMPGHGRRAIRCIGTLTDVTNAQRNEERLLNGAVHDFVTGLPNRALFIDRVARALSAAEPPAGSDVYIILMDIDRFKTVNDALGHEAGDSLLSVIGRRLSVEAGPHDSVARLPGDQFAVLFAGGGPERDIVAFSEWLRRAVARPINLGTQEIFLTTCIGVAHYRESGLSAEQLLKDAAIALYEAKRRGAGSIEVFRTSMRDDRAELVVLEQELRRAIERNEIEVHYQPIARLADMNLAGFEALVRWRHPSLGLLAPESFIGLAEQTGMIKDIGRAVLNEAARQLGIWQRSFRPAEPVFVAVNISSAQLIETELIDDIKQVMHREGVRRESLKIEVTESLVMQYPERAGQILERLRELGVGLACDDFGTGYSSLSSLRKLPFDTLKVDRSFIAADAQDHRATVILEAIVAMAHALGLTIVAEGIENQKQVDRLGELNCDLGQGYFIGRPMTAKQVTDALAGLPYASGSGRTAITWLWERAAKDPAPVPRAQDLTVEDIEQARARQARDLAVEIEQARARQAGESAAAEIEQARARRASELAAQAKGVLVAETPAPQFEPEMIKPAPPLLGSSPMAPRMTKTVEDVEPPPVPEVIDETPAEPEARTPKRTRSRKRKKRMAAEQQA